MKQKILAFLITVAVLSYLFLHVAEAATNTLKQSQINTINMFIYISDQALKQAKKCRSEIISYGSKGLACKKFYLHIKELNLAKKKVFKIPKKTRHKAIANNEDWYKGFRRFDKIKYFIIEFKKSK